MPYFIASILMRDKENKNIHKSEVLKSFIIKSDSDVLTEKILELGKDKCMSFLSKHREEGVVYRYYMTVNGRSQDKVQRMLQHQLIDKEMNFENFDVKLVSLMNKPDNRLTDRIILDLDVKDKVVLTKITNELKNLGFTETEKISKMSNESYFVKETVNGFHILTGKGFNMINIRDLAEFKRDALLFIDKL